MSARFGKLSAEGESLFARQDESNVHSHIARCVRHAMAAWLPSAPNAHRRRARIMGAATGSARGICHGAVSGKTPQGALQEIEAIKAAFAAECDRVRRDVASRRLPTGGPLPHDPNTETPR